MDVIHTGIRVYYIWIWLVRNVQIVCVSISGDGWWGDILVVMVTMLKKREVTSLRADALRA